MPFIGQDWRSPGEAWVKTHNGSWERLKILENSSHSHDSACSSLSSSPSSSSVLSDHMSRCRSSSVESSKENSPPPPTSHRSISESSVEMSDNSNSGVRGSERETPSPLPLSTQVTGYQPYCRIFNRPTRERRAYVSLSEAFWRLDFPGAVRDVRRFNYVCKALDVLVSERLSSLGGQAQKLIFSTLDHVMGQVISTQQNMHIIRLLMQDLNEAMEEALKSVWGRQLGSSALWQSHHLRLQYWNDTMKHLDIQQREEDGKVMLAELPEECLRLILLCLSDHHDLARSKEAFSTTPDAINKVGQIFNEQRLWRELCFFHFKPQQLREIIGQTDYAAATGNDWEQIYQKMKRYFGLKETYAETLHLCFHCRTLFWEPYGHPCPVIMTADEEVNQRRYLTMKAPVPVSPRAFLDFFSL